MNDHLTEEGFTGFQAIDPKDTDWREGGETGVAGQVQLSTGDWRPHLPEPKCQLMKESGISYGDTESCTNFSATNDLATYIQYLVDSAQIPSDALAFLRENGYFDASGKISISPRHSAITSGTTGLVGNNLPKVWQTMKNVGVVPDADCPTPIAEWAAKIASGSYTTQDLWDIWFNPSAVTPAAAAKGLAFLQHFKIQYQWVAYPGAEATAASLSQSLKIAPLQIATAVCAGWNTDDPIKGCGAGSAHATELIYVETVATVLYDIFDHYNPYEKQFASDYIITYAMQGLAVPVATTQVTYPAPIGFIHTFSQQLDPGMKSPEVVALQNALKVLGFFPLTVQSTGNFVVNGITQAAVQSFQISKGIASGGTPSTTGFGRAGPETIAALNHALATAH